MSVKEGEEEVGGAEKTRTDLKLKEGGGGGSREACVGSVKTLKSQATTWTEQPKNQMELQMQQALVSKHTHTNTHMETIEIYKYKEL